MGTKDERLVLNNFINFGFGGFRYRQTAIKTKKPFIPKDYKYNCDIGHEFQKMHAKQPVDFIIYGKSEITLKDGTVKKIEFRIGGEEKTCGTGTFYRSTINESSNKKFLDFCRRNGLYPFYFFVFRDGFDVNYDFEFALNLKDKYILKESFKSFSTMLEAFILEYMDIIEKDLDLFDIVQISL